MAISHIQPQEQTGSWTNVNFASGGVLKYRRTGLIIEIEIQDYTYEATTGDLRELCTLPVGFRPDMLQRLPITIPRNTSANVYYLMIATDGKVSVVNSAHNELTHLYAFALYISHGMG